MINERFRRDLVVVLIRLLLIIKFVTEPATLLLNKGFVPYVCRARRRYIFWSSGFEYFWLLWTGLLRTFMILFVLHSSKSYEQVVRVHTYWSVRIGDL